MLNSRTRCPSASLGPVCSCNRGSRPGLLRQESCLLEAGQAATTGVEALHLMVEINLVRLEKRLTSANKIASLT